MVKGTLSLIALSQPSSVQPQLLVSLITFSLRNAEVANSHCVCTGLGKPNRAIPTVTAAQHQLGRSCGGMLKPSKRARRGRPPTNSPVGRPPNGSSADGDPVPDFGISISCGARNSGTFMVTASAQNHRASSPFRGGGTAGRVVDDVSSCNQAEQNGPRSSKRREQPTETRCRSGDPSYSQKLVTA